MKRQQKKELARQEAEERSEAWTKFSPKQQLERLDWRLGNGVGAKKQRARLQKLIEENK